MLSVKPSSWGLVVGQAVARLESPGAAVQTACNAFMHMHNSYQDSSVEISHPKAAVNAQPAL